MELKPRTDSWPEPSDFRQRFETTVDLVTDGLLILDGQDRVVFASAAALELLGFSQEELLGRIASELFTAEGFESLTTLRQEARLHPGRRQTTTLTAMPSWGQALEVEVILIAPAEGSETYLSLRDVSLSKIIEKELRKSNQFLRKIIMNSVDGIIAADVSGNILLFNQGATRMLGWTEEEVIGIMGLSDLFAPGVSEEVTMRLRRDDPRDGPAGLLNPLDVTVVNKSGEHLPVSLTFSSIYEWGEEVAAVGIFSDLRERVAMERALKETRDYLNNVLENAFDMILTTDLNRNIVAFNRGGERILGYSRAELIGQSVEMLYANPAERRSLMRRVEHFDGGVSNYETKLKHKNGTLVDISLTLSLLYDNEGKVVGTVGISKDITARKKAEADLRQTRDYLNAIVENTPDMIITTDLNRRIVSFNRGAEKILGYDRAQILGVDIEDLYVEPEERQVLMRYLDDQPEGSVNYETQLRAEEAIKVIIKP